MKPGCLLEPKSVPVCVELVAERSSTGIDGLVRGSEMPVVVLRLSRYGGAGPTLPPQGVQASQIKSFISRNLES